MAKRKSTRTVHFSRNRRHPDRPRKRPVSPTAATSRPAKEGSDGNTESSVEAARTKLMRARAVLDCTRYVLLYEDRFEGTCERPSFSDALDVARDLVQEVTDALDRVNLRSLGIRPIRHSNSE